MRTFKNIIAAIFLLSLCAYSTWKEMQWISIISVLLLLGVLYQSPARQLKDLILQLIKNTKQAKIGDFELQIEEQISKFSKEIINKSILTQTLLTNLSSDHIGQLLLLHKQGKTKLSSNSVKNKLRDLRSKGLVAHDKETMEKSEFVWLTPLGNELAEILLTNEKIIE
jgi:hypothetical protein